MHEDIIPKKEIDGRLVALLIGVMAMQLCMKI